MDFRFYPRIIKYIQIFKFSIYVQKVYLGQNLIITRLNIYSYTVCQDALHAGSREDSAQYLGRNLLMLESFNHILHNISQLGCPFMISMDNFHIFFIFSLLFDFYYFGVRQFLVKKNSKFFTPTPSRGVLKNWS